jgi:hypothetical protein
VPVAANSALSWNRLDPKTAILQIRTSIAQDNGRTWEKDTKTHQQRRLTLDQATHSHITDAGEELPSLRGQRQSRM